MSDYEYEAGCLGWVMDKLHYVNDDIDSCKKNAIDAFDFVEDCAGKEYIDEKDPIKRYFVYIVEDFKCDEESPEYFKIGKEYAKKYGKTAKDPDNSSKLLKKVLKELGLSNKTRDTMNSASTTMNQLYELFIETENEKIERENNNSRQKVSKIYRFSRYAQNESDQNEKYKKRKGLEGFLKVHHSIGNYISVPEACNRPRGTGPTMDYWDLTLLYIYEYYSEKNDVKWVEMILGNIETEKALRYKEWLKSFVNGLNEPDWNEFVKRNYMQPFVCVEVDGKWKNGDECSDAELRDATSFGKPLQLWSEHFCSDTPVLPQEEEDFEQFFDNATKRIKKRGELMKEALIKKLENSSFSES